MRAAVGRPRNVAEHMAAVASSSIAAMISSGRILRERAEKEVEPSMQQTCGWWGTSV